MATEHITKDVVISLFEKWSDGYAYIEIPVQDAIRQVSAIPPADVRPVVLCGDCAHWDCDTIEMHDRCNNAEEGVDKTQARFAECLKFSSWAKCLMMREDDYCSVGRFAIKGIKDDANSCCGSYNGGDADG